MYIMSMKIMRRSRRNQINMASKLDSFSSRLPTTRAAKFEKCKLKHLIYSDRDQSIIGWD